MLKLLTPVETVPGPVTFSYGNSLMVLGSCFADNIGEKLRNASFDVMVNPFGTLYNPISIANAIARMESGTPFTEADCVQMGSGSDLYCSFSHHTSFARRTPEEFLEVANEALAEASEFWRRADRVIITLGSAWCFSRDGEVVANCLKRNPKEFTRSLLSVDACTATLSAILRRSFKAGREFIFTVSPIRHLFGGAHWNQLSKSTLLLSLGKAMQSYPDGVSYFPAYEIVLDELRDYRFYGEDLVHLTPVAIDYIWERFCQFALKDTEASRLREMEKKYRQSQHRPMHP